MMPGASNGALMYIIYDPDTKDFSNVKTKLVEEVVAVNQTGTWKNQDFSMSGSSSELNYSVYGNTMEDIKPVVKNIEKIMNKRDDLKDVKASLSEVYDEHTLVIDQDKVKKLGLTTGQIAMAINPNVQSEVLTSIDKDGKK